MSLSNDIKLSKTVWELWHGQDFSFRGGKYITKKVRNVSLDLDMPTGPPLHLYQLNIIKIPLRVSKLCSIQGCVYVLNPRTKTKSKKGHKWAKILWMVTNIIFDLCFTMIYSSENF